MNKFKGTDFKIAEEDKKGQSVRVMKSDTPEEPVVTTFAYEKLKRSGDGDYSVVKAKYGALAATDEEKAAKTQKDRRFSLSPLLRGPLSVEQEEKRAIDEKVRARVLALAEEARGQAVTDGYQDGLKKGYEEAFKKFRDEGASRIEKFDSLLKELEAAKEDIFRANERFLIELVFRVSKMILLRELDIDKEFVLRLMRELIERVGVRENITVRVSPNEFESAEMLKEDIQTIMGMMKNLNVEASKQIKQGGCIIETEWNAIDASIETQLQGIYDALIGKESIGSKK